MTLDDLVAATRALPADAPLVFSTKDGPIGEGYHVTELKLARIDSIDCGARTDAWTEATLQLLDGRGRSHMPVGRFAGILEQSARHIDGLGGSPLRVEFAHGNDGLGIFDISAPELADGRVSLKLEPIRAHCKPAATATQTGTTAACCGTTAGGCCG